MSKSSKFLILFAVAALMVVSSVVAISKEDVTLEYVMAVGDHYDADYEYVNEILNSYVTAEELPVVFFIASSANADAVEIAKMRSDKNTWMDIATSYNLTPKVFYVMMAGKIKNKDFKATYAKYHSVTTSQWDKIELNDKDIIDLVNLRFIYKQHDYNPFEVMSMRSYGKSYIKIYHSIGELKEELIDRQMAAKGK